MDISGDLSNFTSWILQAEMLSRGSCAVLQPLIYLGHRASSKEYYPKKGHYGLFFGIFFVFDKNSLQAKWPKIIFR